jgi:hypothetical protein
MFMHLFFVCMSKEFRQLKNKRYRNNHPYNNMTLSIQGPNTCAGGNFNLKAYKGYIVLAGGW